MGTWASGPFCNDAALDYVGELIDHIMGAVDEFMESPEIDETFDAAFAAIALLNEIMKATPSRPWRDGAVLDGAPIRTAMLRCFDEQIDGLEPKPQFKRAQRKALVANLNRFVAFLRKK
jgi:hypothetical protein